MNKNLKVFGIIAILAITSIFFYALYTRSNKNPETSTTIKTIEPTQYYINQGPGMNPTLIDGQKLNGKEIPASEVRRGDIIVFKSPISGVKRRVKRVVGLPGDTVVIEENGILSVTKADGSKYNPGLSGVGSTQKVSKLVTADSFFVVGDNLRNSFDSRIDTFGLIPFSSLLSIVVL